uniref:Uncharacterized protein n=1 Tax=Varanus komodoensis TaxID=61221 RepID=A0A8D2KRE8_VARKO
MQRSPILPRLGTQGLYSHWLSCWLSPDVNYKPRLTSEKVAGRITASTFVLEQPRCIFNEVVKPTDNVWLVVALSEGTLRFLVPDELPIPLSARELPYQSFGSNSSYMTLKTPVTNYPCPDPGEASEALTVLRVGSETGCITDLSWPDCNGPLPGPGPYNALAWCMRIRMSTLSRFRAPYGTAVVLQALLASQMASSVTPASHSGGPQPVAFQPGWEYNSHHPLHAGWGWWVLQSDELGGELLAVSLSTCI